MSRLLTATLLSAAMGALVPSAVQAQVQGPAVTLPDGAGKPLVEAICTQCHQTNMITQSSGYTRDGWQELIGTMINLASVPDQRAAITEYLAEHFAPKYNRRRPRSCPARSISPSRNG